MRTKDYLSILKNEIHSTVFATVDSDGLPVTRVIDIMLTDDDSLYFITAKGKVFYRQLMDKKYAAISGMTPQNGSLNKKAISVRGRVENIGSQMLSRVFEENPYMAEIYPTEESRTALAVFRMYEGEGEYFDLSSKPIVRRSFFLGQNADDYGRADGGQSAAGSGEYWITECCDGCGACLPKCPQHCIDDSKTPFKILAEHCLHCGNCMETCPAGAVKRR